MYVILRGCNFYGRSPKLFTYMSILILMFVLYRSQVVGFSTRTRGNVSRKSNGTGVL